MLAARLVLAVIAGWQTPATAKPCRVGTTGRSTRMYLEVASVVNGVAAVRLCVVPPSTGLGSYSATLTFDSTIARAMRVDVTGGMQVANANVGGSIRLAGAAPSGFHRGVLATARLKLLHGKSLPRIRFVLTEANSPKGVSVLDDARVTGYPASDATLGVVQHAPSTGTSGGGTRATGTHAALHVDSISPRAAHIDNESVLELTLYGAGFSPTGNAVLFDHAMVDDLASQQNGTVLRFIAPTVIPAHDGVQTRRVEAGKFDVRVRTKSGTSNAVTFTVRGEDR